MDVDDEDIGTALGIAETSCAPPGSPPPG